MAEKASYPQMPGYPQMPQGVPPQGVPPVPPPYTPVDPPPAYSGAPYVTGEGKKV